MAIFGPVQPFGVRNTIAGHFGVPRTPRVRAACWIERIRSTQMSSVDDERAMNEHRIVAGDEVHVVAVALEEAPDRLVARSPEHGRPGDLVAVEVEDRKHRAVASRVEKLDPLPGTFERRGLRFAVTDDGDRHEIGIVEHGAECVRQHVAELATFVNRARGRRAHVARNAAGRRELTKQTRHPGHIFGDRRVDLGVRALEIDVREHRRTAMTGPGQIDDVEVVLADHAIEMRIDEAQPRRGSPMPEQSRLDVLCSQRLSQQRIRQQVDLSDGQVVRGAPVRVDRKKLVAIIGSHAFLGAAAS